MIELIDILEPSLALGIAALALTVFLVASVAIAASHDPETDWRRVRRIAAMLGILAFAVQFAQWFLAFEF